MKKKLYILLILGTMLFTGCETEKTMKCVSKIKKVEDTVELYYNITYKGDYITSIKNEEVVTMQDVESLQNYKTQLEKIYKPYEELDYYDYSITLEDNVVTSILKIDYSKVDTDKMIEIDSTNATRIKNGKIKLSDIENDYQKLGFTCTKE